MDVDYTSIDLNPSLCPTAPFRRIECNMHAGQSLSFSSWIQYTQTARLPSILFIQVYGVLVFFFLGLQSRLSISLALPFPSSIPQDIFFSENLGCYSLTFRPISKQLSNERPSNVKDHLSESCDHHLVVLEKLRYVLFRIHPLHTYTHTKYELILSLRTRTRMSQFTFVNSSIKSNLLRCC